jgi:acyl-CoA thioesterase FadM
VAFKINKKGNAMYQKEFGIDPDFLDELNHVNYLNYVRKLAEVALAEWRAKHGVDLPTLRDEHGLVLVIAEFNVKYFQQLLLGDRVGVVIAPVERVGKRMNFSAVILQNGAVVSEITMSMACIEATTGRRCMFPDHLFHRLNSDVQGVEREAQLSA